MLANSLHSDFAHFDVQVTELQNGETVKGGWQAFQTKLIPTHHYLLGIAETAPVHST
jgi:hypothetical protein